MPELMVNLVAKRNYLFDLLGGQLLKQNKVERKQRQKKKNIFPKIIRDLQFSHPAPPKKNELFPPSDFQRLLEASPPSSPHGPSWL